MTYIGNLDVDLRNLLAFSTIGGISDAYSSGYVDYLL
jgi:hypothetical protein